MPAAPPPPAAAPLPSSPSARPAGKARSSAPREARTAGLEAAPLAAAVEAAPTSALQLPPPAAAPAVPAGETALAAAAPRVDQRKRASDALTDDTLARAVAAAEASRSGPLQADAGPNAATSTWSLVRPADAGRQPPTAPLAALLAAVQREPGRWRWQRGTGTGTAETRDMTPNLLRWLAEADRASASQWRPALDAAAHVGPPSLRLLRDGVLQATLGFDTSAWIEAAGNVAPKMSTSVLPAASIEALKKSLDEATR